MPTKLGFEIHNDQLSTIQNHKPAAMVVLDSIDLLNRAYAVLGAGPVYIFRQSRFTNANTYLSNPGDIDVAVDQWLEANAGAFRALPWAYHCTFQSERISDELAAFEAMAVERAWQRYGVRLCIGNFASGTPTPQAWANYRPALEAVMRHGGLVGLREQYPIFPYVNYGPNVNQPSLTASNSHKLLNEVLYPQNYQQPGEIVGRYRYLRDYCRQNRLDVRIVLTQIGAGRVLPQWMDAFSPNLGGWRSLINLWRQLGFNDTDARYFEDLFWLDQHVYSHDPELIGACIYGVGLSNDPNYELSASQLTFLQLHMQNATRQTLYEVRSLDAEYSVIATRLRTRPLPSLNNQPTGGLDFGETLQATHYTFNEGMLWVKHQAGWSVYTPLVNGYPDYDAKYLEGPLISTPRQTSAVNNFVGTIDEVRSFIRSYEGDLFYISINPGLTPQGARTFSITTFPVNKARRIIDDVHPTAGDPRMTPEAKRLLRDAGQL